MQLECKQCHQPLNLPDDKLPVGRPFSFNCPYCKTKNTAVIDPQDSRLAETRLPEEQAGPPGDYPPLQDPAGPPNFNSEEAPSPPAAPGFLRAPALSDDAFAPVEPPPPMEGGGENYDSSQLTLKQLMAGEVDERPKALVVYDDLDVAESLEHKLDALGFQVSVAMNQRDAAKQLKFTNFTILLIQEDYFGASMSSNHLLRSIQTMEGPARRGMLVIMVSPTMTTLDDLLAFSLSLDAIINTEELGNIERILISTIARARKFYAVYREVLSEQGLD